MACENRLAFAILWAAALSVSAGRLCSAEPMLKDGAPGSSEVLTLLRQHCFDCHGEGASEGNLQIDQLLEMPASDAARQAWWKVLSNVRAGTMPPPDAGTRLSKDEVHTVAEWIKFDAMGIDKELPDPGRVTLRRLNRREYANTIRDLLGVDFNADIAFPPDDTGFGFDNIGDALSLSPMVVEKYLAAASQVVKEAVPRTNYEIPEQRFFSREIRGDNGSNADSMRLNRAHRVGCEFKVVHPGSYTIEIVFRSGGSFEFSPQRSTVVCRLDDEELFQEEVGWDESKRQLYRFEREWQPGTYQLTFELTPKKLSEPVKEDWFADLDIESVSVRGPADRKYWSHPRNYERVFTRDEAPQDASARVEYAREVLRRFGERAFRRPIDDEALERLVEIAIQYGEQPDTTFEAAISHSLIPMLASPRFLFRIEAPDDVDSNEPFPLVDEYALASRLSYFLWSTMPDDELFALARNGQLRAQLPSTVARMLADPRSQALVRNFVGQWLRTRDVEKTSIDPLAVYGLQAEFEEMRAAFRRSRLGRSGPPDPNAPVDPEVEKQRARFQELREVQDKWNADVRTAMRRESEMLFEYIARENRDLAEIVNPGYTFLNERLARHYGIEGVSGPEMRRVDLPEDSIRGGILAQGTMLTVTSNPTRTSPVKRGLYILENVLGTPTPPAPPNVPALEDSSSRFPGREPSLKELLAVHRESALCSSCHSRMDPLGLALENFDALGVWRTEENGQAIDASGQLITGETFRDFRDLRKIIASDRREDFYRCVSQKMLVYALGRGTEYYDEVTLDRLVDRLMTREGKFEELIYGIIESPPFQRQRRSDSETVTQLQPKLSESGGEE
ncbi:MAG: DUF1592 domain-containing protein [Pirellula sp.]|jgi:mono/diheme cytochrome c family protein|nr:DUF1592 domain-containing protein [Pirellula sp.]